jgi:phosphonate transport system substrate-binding protein
MIKQSFAAFVMGATALTSTAAFAQDWRERCRCSASAFWAVRTKPTACASMPARKPISKSAWASVELFPASDYAGVMQGLLAGQLEFAGLGSAGYAGIYLQDPDAVEPLYTTMQIDGSLGYYSVMYTLADSGIESLADMEGRSLAFADPNSTSGYLVPSFELASEEGSTWKPTSPRPASAAVTSRRLSRF